MNKPIVSVVIPIYNTAQYLDDCIQSVVNQTIHELQIILVNDGSVDESPLICDRWKQKDSRIQVIHKENEGLGYTRNAGIAVAEGEYLSFLDSDDTLDADTYEVCIANMQRNGAQASYFGRKTMDQYGEIKINENVPAKLCYNDYEVKCEYTKTYFGPLPNEEQFPYIQGSSCCALYRRDIIERYNIRFCSEREYLSEDLFFNLDICRYAKCVCIIPENFYNYTYNANSLTKEHLSTRFEQSKRMLIKLEEYASDYSCVEDALDRVHFKFLGITRGIVSGRLQVGTISNNLKGVKLIGEDEMIHQVYSKLPMQLMDPRTRMYTRLMIEKKYMKLIILYFVKSRIFRK